MFEYSPIERISKISPEDFYINYYKKQKPVVVEKLTEDWPAYDKWNFDYIADIAGNQVVPLYDNSPVDHEKKINEPIAKMKMSDYIDILRKGPTDLRIFLYNLMKHTPGLKDDIRFPDFGVKLLKGLPMMFFGGTGSNVFNHYDIDYANIFHFHFAGKKRCVIVSPEQTKYMYRLPYSWIQHEDINFDDPDFQKWPVLKKVKPLVTELNHGEMLYMPEGYWHYMQYLEPGFSVSLRSLAHRPANLYHAIANIFVVRHFDNFMRKWKGQAWIDYKNERCIQKTENYLQKTVREKHGGFSKIAPIMRSWLHL